MGIFKFNASEDERKNNEFLDFVKRIQDEYNNKYELDALKITIILAVCEEKNRYKIESANIARKKFSDFVNRDGNDKLIQKYFGGTYEFFRFLYQQFGDHPNNYMFGIKPYYYCFNEIKIFANGLLSQKKIALGRNYINTISIDLNGVEMNVPVYGTMVRVALSEDNKAGKLLGFIVNMLPEHVVQLLDRKLYLYRTTDKYHILINRGI